MTGNKKQLTGIERLRRAARAFSYVHEGFLEQFTAEELLKLHTAWRAATHDYPPDLWSERQVQEAIREDKVPSWEGPFELHAHVRWIDSARGENDGEGLVIDVRDDRAVLVHWSSGSTNLCEVSELQKA